MGLGSGEVGFGEWLVGIWGFGNGLGSGEVGFGEWLVGGVLIMSPLWRF